MKHRLHRRGLFVAAILAALVGAGCEKKEPRKASDRVYPLRGVIVAVDGSHRRLTVRHEEIAGLMPGMTMTFPVAEDGGNLSELSPGDTITAELHLTGHGPSLARISVTGSESIPKLDPSRILQPGSEVGDVRLTDQEGKPFSLSAFRGTPILISFIYTRCPLPWACPLTLSKLARVAAGAGSEARFHILVVTLDPKNDTPAVLKDYARQVDLSRGRWSFATGAPSEIREFAESLGVLAYTEKSQITHSLLVAVVGADGRLVSRHEGRDWKPEDVIAELKRLPRQ